MLPGSRDHTAAAAAAVRANMWNKLQDMIIGGKLPSLDFPFAAGAFTLKAGGAAATLGDGQWTFAGVTSIECRLMFPVGMRLTAVRFGGNRNGGTQMSFEIRKRELVAGSAVVQVATLGGAGSGWLIMTITQNIRIEPNTAYWLQVNATDVANIFGGAIVTADR